MLKKELRVKKERDFNKIYKKGNFIGGDFFNINYINNFKGYTRASVVISKKIAKKAVERNLLKRRVREAIYSLYPSIVKGVDIIVNLKKEVKDKDYEIIKKELENQLKRKGLIK